MDSRRVIEDKDKVDNSGTRTEGDISSNGNSETRRHKIVNFSINNITSHGYSMQLTTKIMKLMKNLLELKQLEAIKAMTTTIPTLKCLKIVSFLSTIDQVILSNLQLQSR